MAEKTLTQDELKALLDTDEGAGKPHRKTVSDYDFAHPNHLSPEQLRSFTRVHTIAANELGSALSTILRSSVKVEVTNVGEQSFASLRTSLPNPTLVNVLSVPPLTEPALLTMDMKLVLGLLDRMLGGPGKAPAKLRPLTKLERGLLDGVTKRFLEQLAAGWKSLAAFTPAVEAVDFDPQMIDVIPGAEAVLVATLNVSGGDMESGDCCFCMPMIALESILGQSAGPAKLVAAKRAQTPEQRKQIDQAISQSALDIEVALGTTTLSIDEVLAIKPGDILVLDQGPTDLLEGRINNRTRMFGRAGRIGKKLCLLVEKTLPAAKQTKKE